MEYINIGTNTILEEYFYPVVNSDKIIKPTGGFWCTNHITPYYNEWLDFIMSKPAYFVRYMGKEDPFLMSGAVVTMKDNARILRLDNKDSFEELSRKYSYDFETLSDDYDDIYFDIYQLYSLDPNHREEIRRLITVNTFLLLNLAGVKDYRAARIDIEPFDYTFEYDHEAGVNIGVADERKIILPASSQYQQLLEDVCKSLKDKIFHLRMAHRDLPSFMIVEMVRNELLALYGEAIKEYVTSKGYDEFRVANSMAIKSFRAIK